MTGRVVIFFFLLITLQQCRVPLVNLTDKIDPDIVLVNIEDGDRAFLGNLLLKIDSLKPIVIGINVFFKNEKDRKQDSLLVNAFKKINNDILVYGIDQDENFFHSRAIFTSLASDEGFLEYERTFDLISLMTPVPKIENKIHESFPLKIVNHWNPDFRSIIKPNQTIPINYTRALENFIHIDGSFLLEINIADFDLKNKIILLGYLGPGEEDKYFTPIRLVKGKYREDEPDTYGLVIIANEIRTILEYKK